MFKIIRSLLGAQPELPAGPRVLEITVDNRVIFDSDSIVNSPAAQEHLAAIRDLQIPARSETAR